MSAAAIQGRVMRIVSPGHVVFAAMMIGIGVIGLTQSDFAPIWPPVPAAIPMRHGLAILCAIVALGCGIGLLQPRLAPAASMVLFGYLLIWFLAFRVPRIFAAPTSQDSWSGSAETGTIVAAAWVLATWLARNRRPLDFATGARGLHIARLLYAFALLIFGVAHFRYPKETAVLVPGWLPAHLAWAYFTGVAFVVAGLAILAGVRARMAAILVAWQLGLFTLLVWAPMMTRHPNAFQQSELVISVAVTAAAWVMADSYATRAGS